MWEKAHGIDHNIVERYSEQKSISHENTFHEDYNDVNFLHKELIRLCEETAFDLREEKKINRMCYG
jgi:DNA polymerase-4